MTYNLEIIHRPVSEYEVSFIYFEAFLSHNVNLHSTLYLQQIFKEQNHSEDCVMQQHGVGVCVGPSPSFITIILSFNLPFGDAQKEFCTAYGT